MLRCDFHREGLWWQFGTNRTRVWPAHERQCPPTAPQAAPWSHKSREHPATVQQSHLNSSANFTRLWQYNERNGWTGWIRSYWGVCSINFLYQTLVPIINVLLMFSYIANTLYDDPCLVPDSLYYFIFLNKVKLWKEISYASPTSWEAYRDRRLTTNFELWVEIFCVPTCFHVRIRKPCLSVCPSVRLSVCPSVCLSAPREKISS